MARTRRKRSHRSRFGRLVRRVLIAGVATALVSAVAAGAILYFELTAALPPVSQLAQYQGFKLRAAVRSPGAGFYTGPGLNDSVSHAKSVTN